jgi:hypothetical protein
MSRIFFLGFILFSSPLYAQGSLEQALEIILKAPWGQGPSELAEKESWTVEPFTILNTFDLQGYNVQAFEKSENSIRLKLFSYEEPSLSASNEAILMGQVQSLTATEDEAAPILGKMTAYLKTRGFAEYEQDSLIKQWPTGKDFKKVSFLRKGDFSALIYLVRNFKSHKDWFARTMIYIPDFQEYGDYTIGEWPKWWYSELIMPEKLIRELETGNIAGILSPSLWNGIINISKEDRFNIKSNSALPKVKDLIDAYETIDRKSFPEKDMPSILILKNYLARFLFICGLEKDMTVEQTKWLQNHGLEYNRDELGMVYHYTETILQKLLKEYPGSYWGQFAFLELLQMGFDTSGTCRGGENQWDRVFKESYSFLEVYPNSEFAPDVRFCIGLAAETLFNLGTMKDNPMLQDSGLSWSQYAEKREGAQKNALFFYEQVLKTPQKAVYENYLKYNLPRLRAGFATRCSYYFCFYDRKNCSSYGNSSLYLSIR